MKNSLSENLKKIRKDNNLSQEQLAEDLGVSRQAISKWESGSAYPEMDKILQLCDKFDLNIDDLLHGDIREVKSEERTKKDFNKVVDSFLSFITDSINMFINMNFKSKIKCLFEQCVIAVLLMIVLVILSGVLRVVVFDILNVLPFNLASKVGGLFEALYILFALVLAAGIMIYIFKTRYLDYYKKVSKREIEEIKEKSSEFKKDVDALKENESRIIIRDPKHSEYSFINIIFKIFIFGVKIFASFVLLFVSFGVVGLFIGFILSFLLYRTGLLFFGLIVSAIACGIIGVDIILILLNFIFNRKNDKKKLIWSFILSLISIGIGIGLILIGSMNFELIGETEYASNFKTETIKIDMNKNLYVHNNVTFIEKDIKNVEIEYSVNKYCSMDYSLEHLDGISMYSNCSNPMLIIKQFVNNINNKKIVFPTGDIVDIKVYASKENIKIMENNHKKYLSRYDYE